MLLWTNDPNWASTDPCPQAIASLTKSLEIFLCHFQDREFHEHLTGDCDIAFINVWARDELGKPVAPMALRLVVPRDEGTRSRLLSWWHPSTSWRWKHNGIHLSDRGWTGLCNADPEYPCRRFMIETMLGDDGEPVSCLDVVDLFGQGYPSFLSLAAKTRLVAFGVEIEDDRKLIKLVPMSELGSFKHQAFSLSREYEVGEYLPAFPLF